MSDEPNIAEPAALIGDPARANMLCALLDGRALTATELAAVANVGAPTASAHLTKLVEGGLLAVERQGRHRYYRLAGRDVAQTLEALATLSNRSPARYRRPGPKDAAMRRLRRCYDHLAGEVAVQILERSLDQGWLRRHDDDVELTKAGETVFAAIGVDVAAARKKRRAFARGCLDWSERRSHLGGALGAALMTRLIDLRWVARDPDSRSMILDAAGAAGLRETFGVAVDGGE